MKFNYINILWCAAFTLAAASCTDEDYKVYDTAQKDSVFFEYRNASDELVDSVKYDFNYDIATVHTIDIPVTLMGMPKDYDRTISILTVADSTNMTEGDTLHYLRQHHSRRKSVRNCPCQSSARQGSRNPSGIQAPISHYRRERRP